MATIVQGLMARVGMDLTTYRKGMAEMRSQTAHTASKISTFGHDMMRIFTRIGVAAIGAFAGATKMAMSFQKGMTYAWTMARVTREEMDVMGKDILDLSWKYGKPTGEIWAAAFDVLSTITKDPKEAIKFLEQATQAAVAGFTSVPIAARGVIRALEAMGEAPKEAGRYLDIMFRIVDVGIVTFEQLSESIGYALSQGGVAGLKFEELGAALAVLTKVFGVEESVTYLNRLISTLISPDSEHAKKLWQEMGLEFGTTALKTKHLAGMMEELRRVSGGSVDVMKELIPEMRAERAATVLAISKHKDFVAALRATKDEHVGLMQALKKALEDPLHTYESAWNKIKIILLEIGLAVLPKVQEALGLTNQKLDEFRESTDYATQASQGMSNALKAVMGIFHFFMAGLKTVVTTVIGALGLMNEGFVRLKAVAEVVFGAMSVFMMDVAKAALDMASNVLWGIRQLLIGLRAAESVVGFITEKLGLGAPDLMATALESVTGARESLKEQSALTAEGIKEALSSVSRATKELTKGDLSPWSKGLLDESLKMFEDAALTAEKGWVKFEEVYESGFSHVAEVVKKGGQEVKKAMEEAVQAMIPAAPAFAKPGPLARKVPCPRMTPMAAGMNVRAYQERVRAGMTAYQESLRAPFALSRRYRRHPFRPAQRADILDKPIKTKYLKYAPQVTGLQGENKALGQGVIEKFSAFQGMTENKNELLVRILEKLAMGEKQTVQGLESLDKRIDDIVDGLRTQNAR